MLRAAALSLICAVLALTAAGCGESGAGDSGDPASLVPAGASFYLQAAVQPEGDRREDALAAAGKIMRTDDPAAKLRELIDKALAEENAGLSWEKDFASWLGEDAGVWATNFQADEPSYAVIIATKDTEAANAALAKFEKTSDNTYKPASHGGIDYKVDDEGVATGVIDDFVVVGTEDAFKRTADTRDGDKLTDSDRYKDAIDDLEDDRLGHYYVDPKPLIDAAMKQDPEAAQNLEQFKSILPLDKLGPVTGAFTANGDGMALDTVITGLPEGPIRNIAALWSGGSDLLGELPGDAWAAFATPKLGDGAKSMFSSFAGAIGGAAVAAQFKQATGLDLQQDVFSWIGDAGVFVRGADMATLDGALVISSTDDARAESAFNKFVGLAAKQTGGAPTPAKVDGADAAFAIPQTGASQKPVVLARGEGRVVLAYGEEAASAAFASDAKLADSDDFKAAAGILGDDMKPAFLLSVADVIALADGLGATDAEFDKARPYLETLGAFTSGGKAEGDRVQSRVAVTLK